MPRFSGVLFGLLIVVGVVLVFLPTRPIVDPVSHTSQSVAAEPDAYPVGWKRFVVKGFHFYARSGTTFSPLQGIDSSGGRISGPGYELLFSLGEYAPDPREVAGATPVDTQISTIDSRHAEILSANIAKPVAELNVTYTRFVALDVPDAVCSYLMFGLPCQRAELSIWGAARTGDDVETVKRIFRTIRFAPAANI